jgi:hypothetical protein
MDVCCACYLKNAIAVWDLEADQMSLQIIKANLIILGLSNHFV